MKLQIAIVKLTLLAAFSAAAQVETYNWPETSSLYSSEKFEIRVREVNAEFTSTGDWIDLKEFYSFQRSYNDHWKVGGDAGSDFMNDRSLTFVAFAFEGTIEVEVKQKLTPAKAQTVEISPKAFGIIPHFFDGTTVRFLMKTPEYVSVDFGFGSNDQSINRDDNRANGFDIKHGVMIFSDEPESAVSDYAAPKPTDPGVVVWSNETSLATIRNADIIYFPAGEHELRTHPGRWERNSSADFAERAGNWVTTSAEYKAALLYRGRLLLGKAGQKVYLAPGAIVYGGFHSNGLNNNWLYGRGIVTGRKHLMHEIIEPESSKPIALDKAYDQITQTKKAFCYYGNGAVYDGVIFLEGWHHTCPSGSNTNIRRTKIIGWCSNNDGIRPGSGSKIDKMFIKTSDDYDYARDPHTVKNTVMWPGVNGAVGQLGWNNLGSGYAEYYNMHVINSEWHESSIAAKANVGIINGGKADAGIKLTNNIFQDLHIEHRTNFLASVKIEAGTSTGYLRNFIVKNITTEYPFSNPAGVTVKQELSGRGETWVEGWKFTNVFIDGVLLTWDNYKNYFNLNLAGSNGANTDNTARARNITFNTEGEIFTIQCTKSAGGSVRPNGAGGAVQIAKGMKQTIVVEPNTGYRIKTITVDGALLYEYGSQTATARTPYIVFNNVQNSHTVDVTFEAGSDYFDFSPISLPVKVADASKVKIYPSPTRGEFSVMLPAQTSARADIFSTDGKLILSQEIQSGSGVINISDLITDTYILRIKQNDDYYLTKVTKF